MFNATFFGKISCLILTIIFIETLSLNLIFVDGAVTKTLLIVTCLPSISLFKYDLVKLLIFSAKKISILFPLFFYLQKI